MNSGQRRVFLILLITILIFSTPAIAKDSGKEIKVLNKSRNFIGKGISTQRDGEYKRVIADFFEERDFKLFREKGCRIKHRLKRSASFDCPEQALDELNVREARVFHILDLEADKQINADKVWAEGIDGSGVNVVILDTGIDSEHIELKDSIKGQKDFVENDDIAEDNHGHGTHVAGIVTGNGINIVNGNYATGVAPGAGVYMLKVCDASGTCLEDDITAAMEYAVNNLTDARIMSLSIGGGNFGSHCDSDSLAAKANWVVDNGFTVVVSAGNDGAGVSSPACGSKVISVGAANKSSIITYWSNYGTSLDIVAPGVEILSTYSCLATGDCTSYWYTKMSGTSMSAPHVAGAAALLLQTKPTATTDEIKEALYNTATPAAGCQKCRWYWYGYCLGQSIVPCTPEREGAGIVNAYGAYQYIQSSAPECTIDADCDDGIYCNGAESCQSGACQSGTPIDCSGFGDQCNNGVCDEASKGCVVQPKQDGTQCVDGKFCTLNGVCTGGVCGGSANSCSDGVDCTVDSCDEVNDVCVNSSDNSFCNDGLFCNGTETCDSLSGCEAGTQVDCSYLDDQCNAGVCNENTDSCEKNPANEGLECNDGLFCSINEKCQAGLCTRGSARSCDDFDSCTSDSCNESIDECEYLPALDGTACDDGEFCTINDACSTGVCGGAQRNCSDSVDCTVDSCNENIDACVNTPDNSFCSDGLFCNGSEVCDALLGCQAGVQVNCDDDKECTLDNCSENIDACEFTPVADNTSCSGGICCSGNCGLSYCSADLDCDDSDACTIDSCNNAGTCSASCSHTDVTSCINDDGCCPAGCNFTSDNDCPAGATMHVGDITLYPYILSFGRWGTWCRVTAIVPILDAYENGVGGVNVYGSWSGAYNANVSATTNGEGNATFRTSLIRNCGTFTFAVNDAVKAGWTYDPAANVETSDTITAP